VCGLLPFLVQLQSSGSCHVALLCSRSSGLLLLLLLLLESLRSLLLPPLFILLPHLATFKEL
jgi:hypothetical protein